MNVIVGENASGKTAIVDAVRLLLREDEFGFSPIKDSDFYKGFSDGAIPASKIEICGQFGGLSGEEEIVFLPWSDLNGNAKLSLQIENRESHGRYKRQVWGGASKSSAFEWELFDKINCIYLPPLRDAEAKLREGKSSRLARLLKNLEAAAIREAREKGTPHSLEKALRDFNQSLATDKDHGIAKANKLIKNRLRDAVGEVFGQDTRLQFSEVGFNRIVESLRLFFFPTLGEATPEAAYRSLEENSLGYNNLLYLATVLAELIQPSEETESLRVLLIEEPEAHLHPQLQIRLLQYLENTAKNDKVQLIVTTHSPVLAASASLRSMIHLSAKEGKLTAVSVSQTGLGKSEQFIDRWLDATKSTLLFAKGVILVEGIAEAILLPVFARRLLSKEKMFGDSKPSPKSLEDAGVSVINMNGIYFSHFMQLFCNLTAGTEKCENIPIRCSGITDRDPPKHILQNVEEEPSLPVAEKPKPQKVPFKPTPENPGEPKNHAWELVQATASGEQRIGDCRIYGSPLKTLEYDLAFEGENLKHMAAILAKNWPTEGKNKAKLTEISVTDWSEKSDDDKANAAFEILARVDDDDMGKGRFAQLLADSLSPRRSLSDSPGTKEDPSHSVEFSVPSYIRSAIVWACGGNPNGL